MHHLVGLLKIDGAGGYLQCLVFDTAIKQSSKCKVGDDPENNIKGGGWPRIQY